MSFTENRKIRKNVFIAAPPQRVFDALTASEHWDRYFTTGMQLDPKPGGVCNFRWENWGPDRLNQESPGRVLEIESPRRFVFEWGRPGMKTTARLDIDSRHDGSVLTLVEDGYPDTSEGLNYMLECSAHWGELLTLIKFYVEHGITYQSPAVENTAETDAGQRS